MATKKFQLNFDKFQRYQIVEDVISSARTKSQLSILDIGTPANYLAKFLPNDRIVTIDYSRSKGRQFVQSDALQMPFPDASFDVAISLDVLEHIPTKLRPRFLAEQARVASDLVLVGAPFQSVDVELAERIAWEQIKQRYGTEHKFLTEHQQYGLPDLPRTLKALERQGLTSLTLPNGYLPNWLLMLLVDFHAEWSRAPKSLQNRVLETYNKHYYASDNREPSYRHIIVASRHPELVRALPQKLLKPTPVGPPSVPLAPSIVKLFDATLATHVEQAVKRLEQQFAEERQAWTTERQTRERRHAQELRKHQRLARENIQRTAKDAAGQLREAKREIERLNSEIHNLHRTYQTQLAQRQEQLDAQQTAHHQTLSALEQRLATVRQQLDAQEEQHQHAEEEWEQEREKSRQLSMEQDRRLAQVLADRQAEHQGQLDLRGRQLAEASEVLRCAKADAQASEQSLREALAEAQRQYQAVLQQRDALETAHQAAQTRFAEQLRRLQEELSTLHAAYQTQLDTLTRASSEAASAHAADVQRLQSAHNAECERLRQQLDDADRLIRQAQEAHGTVAEQREALQARVASLFRESELLRREHHRASVEAADAVEALRLEHRKELAALELRAEESRTHLEEEHHRLFDERRTAERLADERLRQEQERSLTETARLEQAIRNLQARHDVELRTSRQEAQARQETFLEQYASLRREHEETVRRLHDHADSVRRQWQHALQDLAVRLERTQEQTSEPLTGFFTECTAPLVESLGVLQQEVRAVMQEHTERYERLVRHAQVQQKAVDEQRRIIKELQSKLSRLASIPLNRWLLKRRGRPLQDRP